MALDLLKSPILGLRHEHDGEHEAGARHGGVHPEDARVTEHRHQVRVAPAVEEDGRVAAAGGEASAVGPDTGGVELSDLSEMSAYTIFMYSLDCSPGPRGRDQGQV